MIRYATLAATALLLIFLAAKIGEPPQENDVLPVATLPAPTKSQTRTSGIAPIIGSSIVYCTLPSSSIDFTTATASTACSIPQATGSWTTGVMR